MLKPVQHDIGVLQSSLEMKNRKYTCNLSSINIESRSNALILSSRPLLSSEEPKDLSLKIVGIFYTHSGAFNSTIDLRMTDRPICELL